MTRIASCGSMKQRGMRGKVRARSDGTALSTRSFRAFARLFRTMEQSLDRSSLPDQVFHRLAADVLAGRYAPGERLPTQRALAASLGVNMASVREGIKRLEQLRLVDVRQGDAMRVLDWRSHGGLEIGRAHV